jgi:hypothetical protein
MATSIPELIALELVERLEASEEFKCIERSNRDGSSLSYGHLTVQVVQSDSQRTPELDCPGNPPALAYTLLFELKCVCRDSQEDEADKALATNPNDMAAAAVVAITATGSTWYTMAGNAINSRIGNLIPFDSVEGEFNGMTVPIEIIYRVSENNPYQVRA